MAPMKSKSAMPVGTGAPKANAWASTADFSACKIPEEPSAFGKPCEVNRMVPKVTAVRRIKRMEKVSPVRDNPNGVSASHLHGAGRQPFEQDFLKDAMLRIGGQQLKHGAHRVYERQTHAADAEHADAGIRKPAAKEKHQRRG